MIGLVQVVQRSWKEKEKAEQEVIERQFTHFLAGFHPKSVYICHKVNGFWFRLSLRQWSDYRGMASSTLIYRRSKGMSIAEQLGFKKVKITRKRKK